MPLTDALFWLTLTLLMTALFWLPYGINRSMVRGPARALGNPRPDDKPHDAWADRAMRAHRNAVENLVLFAPLVLIAHATQTDPALVGLMVQVYFWARAAHYVVYTLGIPVVRTGVFAVGYLAMFVVGLAILGLT